MVAISCSDKDEFLEKDQGSKVDKVGNTFDFSTSQKIDLIVDYSSFETYGPVWFSVYDVNPVVDEGTGYDYVDESIEPLFQGYTDQDGKFDATITLPAYARVLHVVTGDFMLGLRRNTTEVVNGEAKVKVNSPAPAASRFTRASGTGTSTNDMSGLYNTSYIINHSTGANTNERIYKDWHTPLGTWNSATGRPDYLLSAIASNLVFSEEELAGLYDTAKKALNSGTTCKEKYRSTADITLITDSEVSMTALGSMTCWNSSLGYYYYMAEKPPTKPSDLNIIMLFPNTQDGQRDLSWDYQNNIGTVRGDVVQLMYYPNIAKGDYSGATTVFPKGTKIGFILKPNGWAGQGKDYCSKKSSTYFWDKKLNIWAASTEGLSYCRNNGYKLPNPNGEARTAKFSYKSPNGNSYAIVSFEDACDDDDYDDLLFALNPKNAFAELPEVEDNKTTTHGVYAFEDRWPSAGDYDMNDVVVDYKQEMFFNSGKVKKQIFYLTTYQNFVELKSGLALKLVKKATPSKIVTKRMAPGGTATTINYTVDGDYYYLTEDITAELGTTYIFEIQYSASQELSNLAAVQPFIYRPEEGGKQWELHIPYEAPSPKMNRSYFGTEADCTSGTNYFVREGNYPFAFYLEGGKVEYLSNILKRENENRHIDYFFPEFLQWSISNGAKNADWYLHPRF
jgi:LruC domain-containing protein